MIYFDNPYRTLCGFGNERRAVIGERARALGPWNAQGCDASGRDPLARFAPLDRTRLGLYDAERALADVGERLAARLVWFSDRSEGDHAALAALAAGNVDEAAALWSARDDVDAQANLARLYHLLILAREFRRGTEAPAVEIPIRYTWRLAIDAWKNVLADDRFWALFATDEAESGYEPRAMSSQVTELRERAWTLLLEPSREHLERLVANGEHGLARDHLDDRLTDGVPRPFITKLGDAAFARVYEAIASVVKELNAVLDATGTRATPVMIERAYRAYGKRIIPILTNLTYLTGKDFAPTRRACDKSASFLESLVERAVLAGDAKLAASLQDAANDLMRGALSPGPATGSSNRTPTPAATKKKNSSTGWVIGGIILLVLILLYAVGQPTPRARYDDPAVSSSDNDPTPVAVPEPDSFSATDSDDASNESDTSIEARTVRASGYMIDADMLRDSTETLKITIVHLADTLATHVEKLKSLMHGAASGESERLALKHARDLWRNLCRDKWKQLTDQYLTYTLVLAKHNRAVEKLEALELESARYHREPLSNEAREYYDRGRDLAAEAGVK